jgi:hypothetical protein
MSPIAIIHGTPTWVWVLLVVLVSRGIKAMKGGTAPLSKLAIVPLIFAGWGIAHLATQTLAGWHAAFVWLIAAAVGTGIGMLIASRTRFTVDPIEKSVTLPGSIVPLVLILATFAAKFWIGFEMATLAHPASLALYVLIDASVSGMVAGIFGGRFLTYLRTMKNASARMMLAA